MATQTLTNGSRLGNVYIDSLVWGCKWIDGPITYAFGPTGYTVDGESTLSYTTPEKDMFRAILQTYSNVCNITFSEVSFALNSTAVNMVEWKVNALGSDPGYITLGWHDVPDGTYIQNWGAFSTGGDYWSTNQGSLGYSTVVHELGHALGLAHPHDGGDRRDATVFPGVKSAFDSYGNYAMNQGIWTVMSYNSGWATFMPPPNWSYGDVFTPMALDVAALQKIYGANTSYNTSNNIYTLPDTNAEGTGWACIWDAGGIDTISAGTTSSSCYINLNAAPLTGLNAGGYVSRIVGIYGGSTIANGVVIENASGGSGDDTLIGNIGNNSLQGGNGSDVIYGGLGNDTLFGNAGVDFFVFDTTPSATINCDLIKDFNVADDTIQLAKSVFTKFSSIASMSTLASANFVTGTKALDKNDYIIFNSANGALFYDPDGSGKNVAIQFATIDIIGSGTLTSSDFIII